MIDMNEVAETLFPLLENTRLTQEERQALKLSEVEFNQLSISNKQRYRKCATEGLK